MLQGPAAQPTTLDLYGVFGSFRTINSSFDIKYISTFARPEGTDGHAALLRELKPMRDRVQASALNDLSSLLQRDLNDRRVAHELVPYLLGNNSEIGFFPAILAVVVPKDYLQPVQTGESVAYPHPEVVPSPDNTTFQTNFGDCWHTVKYGIDGQESPLGMIKVVLDRTQIIVLDGQHRANAFRYLAGVFDTDSIYQTFYADAPPPQPLDAQLPVTLIWFEAQGREIDPRVISRRLFVDVNNKAKPVSSARTILLDDRTVTALGTQSIYNGAASRSFSPDRFSLLHCAFDMDADLSKTRLHRLALTAPEIVESAVAWGLFGGPSYDVLNMWHVQRPGILRNISRFAQIFPSFATSVSSEEQDERRAPYFEDADKANQFRTRFTGAYGPVLTSFFDSAAILRPHFEATQAVQEWVEREADTTTREVWRKVFCGGEGLYWVFQDPGNTASRAQNYHDAINNVERQFSTQRAQAFSDGDRANGLYEAICSKAFLNGYVMAVEYLAREEFGDRCEAADQLVSRLNSYSVNQWAALFARLRPLILDGTDPKRWPTYRNLLLRLYDGNSQNFYSNANLLDSPDWRAFERQVARLGQAFIDADQRPTEEEQRRRLEGLHDSQVELLRECGLESPWFERSVVVRRGLESLEEQLSP